MKVSRMKWSSDGRLIERIREYPGNGAAIVTRTEFVRHPDGYVSAYRIDEHNDGTIDREEDWDLSCFEATPKGIRKARSQ